MKILLILFLLSSTVFAQEFKIKKDRRSGKNILIGITTKKVFQDTSFAWWFNSEYTNYNVDRKTIEECSEKFEGKIIKTVLGTWCSDSRREVPRFIKILDFVGFPDDKHYFISVDREKKGLSDEIEGLNIEFVPTFIIYEHGLEIGRIIESPMESLEIDLAKILN